MIKIGVTNRKLCEDFYKQIDKISKSQLDYLIIREKDLNDEELLQMILKIKEKMKDTNIKIIVNSNINVAENADTDGLQLSFKDFIKYNNKLYTESEIKSNKTVDNFIGKGNNYKRYKILGVSIHNYEEGISAYNLGADYVIYGHVFKTDCKKDLEPRGIREIENLSKEIDIPIVGIGGIGKNNYKEVINAGAKGIAIMSSLMTSQEPTELIAYYK